MLQSEKRAFRAQVRGNINHPIRPDGHLSYLGKVNHQAAKGRRKGPSTLERGDVAERQGGRLMFPSRSGRGTSTGNHSSSHPSASLTVPSGEGFQLGGLCPLVFISSPFSDTTKSHGRIHHPPVALYRLRCFSNQVLFLHGTI